MPAMHGHLCIDGKINPRTIVQVGITHPDLVELAAGEKHKGMGEMQASEIAARSRGRMAPTDISNPKHFHKVVDCQWACPTHTPVPEYIRLIAQRRYAAAYMLNWESNVFPGHPRSRVRSSLRAGLPARPRGGEARRHLPPEARRRRLQGRDRCLHAGDPEAEERQAHRPDRRRSGFSDGGARSDAARLFLRAVREGPQGRRADAQQHPVLPPARSRARRGGRPHRRASESSCASATRSRVSPAS